MCVHSSKRQDFCSGDRFSLIDLFALIDLRGASNLYPFHHRILHVESNTPVKERLLAPCSIVGPTYEQNSLFCRCIALHV